ncbi:MAG: hypothetical protein AB2A00_13045 [Myxococcota bacterium]
MPASGEPPLDELEGEELLPEAEDVVTLEDVVEADPPELVDNEEDAVLVEVELIEVLGNPPLLDEDVEEVLLPEEVPLAVVDAEAPAELDVPSLPGSTQRLRASSQVNGH